MLWFKKKEAKQDAASSEGSEDSGDDESKESKPVMSGNLEVEFTKIKSSLEALNEVRKANAEQFTRISEQIGELRGALMDSNKAISVIEVASTKAVDMVNSVQPDKLMIEVRKEDGKVEALRANIEANEAIMKDIMKEMKGIREQMNFYKGVDQVIKMNNEIKQELVDIKKTEGLVGKHADRVETIFIEVEKKFYDFEKFNEAVKELDRSFKKIAMDFDKIRVSVEEKSDKKEVVRLVDKFSDFEKHTSSILKLLDQKSRNTVTDLNSQFMLLKNQLEKKFSTKLDVKGLSNDESGKAAEKSADKAEKSAEKPMEKSPDKPTGTNAVQANDAQASAASDGTAPTKSGEPSGDKKSLFGFMKK